MGLGQPLPSNFMLDGVVRLYSRFVDLGAHGMDVVKDYIQLGRMITLDRAGAFGRLEEGINYSLEVRNWWYCLLLWRTLWTIRVG